MEAPGGGSGPPLDFRAMPKIELHAHLSGSISRQCLHEIWSQKKGSAATAGGEGGGGGGCDLEDPLVAMPANKHDYDLETFFPLFSSYIYRLVDSAAALAHATRAVVRDFAADGVVYLELRTTPRALPGLDKAGYIDVVLRAMAEAEAEVEGEGEGEKLEEGKRGKVKGERCEGQEQRPGIHTRLILSVDRRDTPADALEVVALARRFRARGVVGVDLCGDPARGDVGELTPAFRAVKAPFPPLEESEGERELPPLGITLHFAEAAASSSAEELQTLLGWAPDRLGHVVHVPEGVRRQILEGGKKARKEGRKGGEEAKAKAEAKGVGLGLELCLSCNVHAGMVSGGFAAHHFGRWWREEGVVVVPCTDDVGVFGSPLSNEWRLIERHFELRRDELLGLARRGVDVIFGGEAEKRRLREVMW